MFSIFYLIPIIGLIIIAYIDITYDIGFMESMLDIFERD